jgi:group II intron reverse transcriptase/maturase
MRNPENVLKSLTNCAEKADYQYQRLYRNLYNPEFYLLAYQRIYAKPGNMTAGTDGLTIDGMGMDRINKIIASMKDHSYQPKPARREYIKKQNDSKKKRPLGIPSVDDKLVQEVMRYILESIYEPVFSPNSHGFRPRKSCHTALKQIKRTFTGTKWFIEGDIKGCFDNINHCVLIEIIRRKIKDARLIKLLYKFLKAGYLEDWKYNNTYSGTPQGGIISPLLANIYLHELDKFAEQLQAKFFTPSQQKYTPEYDKLRRDTEKLRRRIKIAEGEKKQNLLEELKVTRTLQLKTPAKSQTDKLFRYVRYADDFLIGVNGSKVDCEWIKSELKSFIGNTLKMELSEEKTLITHSGTHARFLGYDVSIRRNGSIKPNGQGYTPNIKQFRRVLHTFQR